MKEVVLGVFDTMESALLNYSKHTGLVDYYLDNNIWYLVIYKE